MNLDMDDQHDLFFDATDAKRKPGLGQRPDLVGAPLTGRAAVQQQSRHQSRTRTRFPLADGQRLWNVLLIMKRVLAICSSAWILFLVVTNLSAQTARQLTRRIVPPPNNASPAKGTPASRPAPTPPPAVPSPNNTAVPAPPPPADAEKAKQETLRKTIEFQKKRAAEGSPSAQYELGLRYLKGDGVDKDEVAGMKLLEDSAKQDYTLAKKKIEELKEKKKK